MASKLIRLALWGGAAMLAAVAAFVLWFVFLRGDAPPAVDLGAAVSTLTTPGTDAASATSAAPASTAPSTSAAPPSTAPSTSAAAGELDGTWVIAGDGTSFVGYRVLEELSGFGTNEAAGRTADVTATLAVAGTLVEAIEVEADLTTLVSDDGRRDRALQTRGLESGRFPTARFTATAPVEVPAGLAEGTAVAAEVAGEFMLHGVTRPVTAAVEAQLVEDRIVVVGSIAIALADYDIDPPTGFSVLSIDENGTAEFQLVLQRS